MFRSRSLRKFSCLSLKIRPTATARNKMADFNCQYHGRIFTAGGRWSYYPRWRFYMPRVFFCFLNHRTWKITGSNCSWLTASTAPFKPTLPRASWRGAPSKLTSCCCWERVASQSRASCCSALCCWQVSASRVVANATFNSFFFSFQAKQLM